ncbi:DUF3613 domain-containing protein [Achromobacter animicus]|uniref:DUF3613 domain-containing protein n=1 Tax=Achromobacter animicus TaxID=1389935 RepID=UPI001468E274|nr:DUF3613 domain-containing protein [Achromobacter animicus]CAB3867948.1 hypothetical protein LMG26691_02829 [Achromobacter animicus]
MIRSLPHALLMLACAAMASSAAHAQTNAPLTGGMSAAPGAAAPGAAASPTAMPDRPVVQQVQTPMPAAPAAATATTASAASSAPAAPEAFGDVTRGLLAAQADGRRAGNALPVLGPVSTAAWNRYVESFKQPIPVWFDRNVEIPNVQ